MSLAIRPYRDADFDAVTTLWFESWHSTGVPSTGVPSSVTLEDLRERWPKELARGWDVHVGVDGAAMVGFVALEGDKLMQLFVAPAHQGKGLGKQLLDFVKKKRPQGFNLVTAAQTRAGKFYAREGLVRGKTDTHPVYGFEVVHFDWKARP